jgi:hypothetical protein
MKRIAFLSVIFLCFGLALASADEDTTLEDLETRVADLEASVLDSATWAVDGEGSVTFGFDLEEGTVGFANAYSSSMTLQLIPEDDSDVGEGDVYGWIELADFNIYVDEDGITATAPTVTATLMLNADETMWITVYGEDGMAEDAVALLEDDEDDDYEVIDDESDDDLGVDLTTSGGISFGLDTDAFAVTLHVASEGDYSDESADGLDGWSVGVDSSIDAGPATIGVNLVKGISDNDDNDLGVGLSVSLDIDTDTIAIDPSIGVDVYQSDEDELAFEIGFGLDVALDADSETTIAIDGVYSEDADTDVEITLGDSDGGLIPGVDLGLVFGLYDLEDWRADLDLSYAIALAVGTLTPALGFDVNSFGTMGMGISVTIADAIPNTTFDIDWTVDSLTDASGGGGSEQDLGQFTVTTTIDY